MPLSSDHLALLGRQHWVASTSQLNALGLGRRAVDHLKVRQILTPCLPGVVQLGGVPTSENSRRMAALLYIGEDVALTTQTGGSVYGLRRMKHPLVHVIVSEVRKPRAADWIRVHRTSWLDEGDIAISPDGLRVLAPLRLLFELAAVLPGSRFFDAAEDMWHKGLVAPTYARDFLQAARRRGRTGVARLEEWLERIADQPSPMMSGLETSFSTALERAGLPIPARQFPILLLNGIEIHYDLAYPDAKLGLEPGHSWWHGGDARARADNDRDAWCAEVGWQTMRFDEVQLRNEEVCARTVRNAYFARLKF